MIIFAIYINSIRLNLIEGGTSRSLYAYVTLLNIKFWVQWWPRNEQRLSFGVFNHWVA